MKFSHFFIRRPIFAAVLSIMIVLLGLLALLELPIAQYPEVAPPTVYVTALYPGASADVVASTVATPLEQQINGVEDMLYMTSQCSSDGTLRLGVTFKTGTDLNKAQVLVQNRVAVAEPTLPEDVRRLGVTTLKRSPSITLIVHLISPSGKYDDLYLGNYAMLQVRDTLSRLPGVGEARVFGASDYSMRIWLDPNKASARNLTAGEIVAAIREQNVQVAAGVFGQSPQPENNLFQLTARTQGRLVTEEQFGDIVLKTGTSGQVTRLRDVARIELGAKSYSMDSLLDGKPASGIGIFQLPGSNAIETANAVRAAMAKLKKQFPEGLDYRIVFDTTMFVRESIRAVLHTLLEAMVLVVLVVVLFLQNWRASLIPLLAVPVSLVGTFAAMAMFGFSLNNLSLFGLVLSIGIVVDDAIVVVENVERNIALGLSPIDATKKAMDEVSSAVVAIALVLSAVFIPTAFMSGLTGRFYQQFALTIAVSTLISAFNSLTLSPALAALLLQPHHAPKDFIARMMHYSVDWLFQGFNRVFETSRSGYVASLRRILRHCSIGLFLYVGLLGLTWYGFHKVPTGFIPTQDKGYLIGYMQLPDGASLERTKQASARMAKLIRETDGVLAVVEMPGMSFISFGIQANATSMFIPLKPFEERVKAGLTDEKIAAVLQAKLGVIQDGFNRIIRSPAVDGLGLIGGFKLQVQDRAGLGFPALQAATYQLIAAAAQDKEKRIVSPFTTFRAGVPQVFLDVDRSKAKMMQVPLDNVWDTLQVYLGSLYVNDFNVFGRPFQVTIQADAPFRKSPEDVLNLKTRNLAGDMVPLGTLVKVREDAAPASVARYNMYNTAEISGGTAPGVSSGEAIQIMDKLAEQTLPPGMSIEWTDLSLLQILAGNSAVYIFPLCVLMVFLVLAAQFESWSLPLAIILIVPMCLLSAIGGIWARHMDNNLFAQIGLVVLIGLACKNAILIVEFARQLQDSGKSRTEAALESCRLRLRPILMTSFAFIFGVVPLLLATGAGGEMRRAIGTAVFFGMLGVTFFGIFLTPIFYVVIRRVVEGKKTPKAQTPVPQAARVGPVVVLLLAGLSSALLLNGCAVGPNYEPPKTQVSTAFTHGNQTNMAAGQVAIEWWRGFNDPLLDRLVDRTVSSNLDLQIATAHVREARALRCATVANALPVAQADAGYSKGVNSFAYEQEPRNLRQFQLFTGGFDATWELDIFGRVRREIQSSTANLMAKEATRQDVMVTLIAEVARNYFDLRGEQNQLEIARKNAENQRETWDLTISKLQAGRATELDSARARAQLEATLAFIPVLEAETLHSIHRISVLTGQQPCALEGELSQPGPWLLTMPALVNIGNPPDLLRRRPDIRAAERSLASATALIGVATSDLFPKVTFDGTVGLQAMHPSGLGQGGSDFFSFGPNITWAALDLGHVRARIQAARANADAQLATYEQTVLIALEETENALVDFGHEQVRRDHLRESERFAAQAMALARQRYEGGVADFLPVLDAERTQLDFQTQFTASNTRTVTSLIAIYKALGGGWEIGETNNPSALKHP